MITAGVIFASGLALAGAYFWLRAMFSWLDGDYPDESNRSFPEPLVTTFRDGERGGGGRPAWPAQSAGAASRQTFARYHRRLRRQQIMRQLRGNHLR